MVTGIPLRQATRSVTNIYAVVPLVSLSMDAIINETNSFRLKITALARFSVGITPTQLYEIKVSCCTCVLSLFKTTT
jgi:hypothetical protein